MIFKRIFFFTGLICGWRLGAESLRWGSERHPVPVRGDCWALCLLRVLDPWPPSTHSPWNRGFGPTGWETWQRGEWWPLIVTIPHHIPNPQADRGQVTPPVLHLDRGQTTLLSPCGARLGPSHAPFCPHGARLHLGYPTPLPRGQMVPPHWSPYQIGTTSGIPPPIWPTGEKG